MNTELSLRVLGEIMQWSDDKAREEFKWLKFMSQYKYDEYREYLAGARFTEHLANWLQQFEQADRESAYNFVRNDLIFIGSSEIQRLVERFYPEVLQKNIIKSVTESFGIMPYKFWSNEDAVKEFECRKRKTLIMGLSDGAHIDSLRRANSGTLVNEQIVLSSQIDDEKWKDLLAELNKDLKTIDPKIEGDQYFSSVYLVDDFTASGTTFIRFNKDEKKYKGKIKKFRDNILEVEKDFTVLDKDWRLYGHHYLATKQAEENIQTQYEAAKSAGLESAEQIVEFSYGHILPKSICIDEKSDTPFAALCKKYYDASIEDRHAKVAGNANLSFGYAQCGLPLILEHNTPNNTLALLWAETAGGDNVHKMRPLFRRRQRHS